MPRLTIDLPASLVEALDARSRLAGGGVDALIAEAVAAFLDKPMHTLFQVSTSRSLVAGK